MQDATYLIICQEAIIYLMILLMLHVNMNKLHVFLFFFHFDCQEFFDEPATPTHTPILKKRCYVSAVYSYILLYESTKCVSFECVKKILINYVLIGYLYTSMQKQEKQLFISVFLNELRISVYFTFPCCSVSSVTIPKTRLFIEMLSFEVNDLSVFSRLYAYILMCMV